MSKELLEKLNGSKNGQFRAWLDRFEGEPRIAWYPSAHTDFRDLLYLHSAYSRINPATGREPESPNIFLHTDYYPYKHSRFLDTRSIHIDEHTRIKVQLIEELERCDLPLDDRIVNSPEGSQATGRVLFLMLDISSDTLGEFSYPVLYVFSENAAFCAERVLPCNGKFSHIVHIRFGGGLGGGGKSTGVWLLNVLRKLNCEVFITDSRYGRGPGEDRIYELYPALCGNEDESHLEQIRKIQKEKWSDYGAVSWMLAK